KKVHGINSGSGSWRSRRICQRWGIYRLSSTDEAPRVQIPLMSFKLNSIRLPMSE
ncbi:unnamed protein product, partial [Nesidiocoris tenuis]